MKKTFWNINKVEIFFNNLRYTLISNEYINNITPLIFRDDNNYLYCSTLNAMQNNKSSSKFHKSNPYTIQNIKLWCKLSNKPFELLSENYEGNVGFLEWKCLKEDCGENFQSSWNSIISGYGCPYCAGQKISLSNCLATKNPELAKEWHPSKNENLTPYDVTVNCGKRVWWICSKNPKHEWQTAISNRSSNKGCPFCEDKLGRKLPSEDYNLLINNPVLCKEYNYDKNDKKPNEFTPNSRKKVWWKCKDCGHEWEAVIKNRNGVYFTGCPECSKSKGEKKIKEWLDVNKIYYIPQKEYKGLVGVGRGNLSYDFYLPDYNLLIEYQGEQHKNYIKGFHKNMKDFEKQLEHDRRKREYAKNNNIDLLEIWYWDFDNIDEITSNRLVK